MIFEKDKICDDIIKNSISQKYIDIDINTFVKNIIKYFERCSREINIIYIQDMLGSLRVANKSSLIPGWGTGNEHCMRGWTPDVHLISIARFAAC